MPRNTRVLKKLSYPYRDHILALKILTILDKYAQSSTKNIASQLSTNSPYSHARVKTTLQRLKEFNFCIEYKRDYQRRWSLSIKGKLVVFSSEKGKKLSDFVKRNADNKTIKMVGILLQNHKKEHVELLIDRLNHAIEDGQNLVKVSREWYEGMKNLILNMDIDENQNPILFQFKNELSIVETINKIIKARGKDYLVDNDD